MSREERQGLNHILRASRDKYRDLVDSVLDPMFTVDRELRIVSLNRAFARMVGVHPREIVGRSCREVVCRLMKPYGFCSQEECPARSFFESGEAVRRYVSGKNDDGAFFCMEVVVSPVYTVEGTPEQASVVYRDVTPIKRSEEEFRNQCLFLEAEVAKRTERLERAHQELLELEQFKKHLIQTLVHDMKGPVGELMGNLDLMRMEPLSDMQKECLDLAEAACEDLLRMIMNLLDISRLEEGRLTLNREVLDPEKVIRKVVGKFKAVIRLKRLDVRVSSQGSCLARADSGLLERVIQNLLVNAIDATPENGRIELDAALDATGAWVVIRVRDTGRGIPERIRPLIFQRFASAPGESGGRSSTGLGLSFCKMAVEAHGGVIEFESREGEGTTFLFRIPAAENTEADPGGADRSTLP